MKLMKRKAFLFLLSVVLLVSCDEKPSKKAGSSEIKSDEVVKDDVPESTAWDSKREIKNTSKGELTKSVFHTAKEGMTIDEVKESVKVDLTLHTEQTDSSSGKLLQAYIWDSKERGLGGAIFMFVDGKLDYKEENLKLDPEDHYITEEEYNAFETGMNRADIEAIAGSRGDGGTMGYETDSSGTEVMVETAEFISLDKTEKIILHFKDNKLTSKEKAPKK